MSAPVAPRGGTAGVVTGGADTGLPSISGRLTRWLVLLSLLTVALVCGVVSYVVGHEMDELMDHELHDAAELTLQAFAVASAPLDAAPAPPMEESSAYDEHLVWQLVVDGRVLRRSHRAPEQPILTAAAAVTDAPGGQWRALAMPAREAPGAVLVVAQSFAERSEVQREILQYALPGALGLSLLGILAMNWRIRRELDPLTTLSRAVARYDPLVKETAPLATGRSELRPIEQSIRGLGERLGQRIVSERAFGSHAAHALRTPVAGIDTQLAVALREAPESLQPRLRQVRSAARRLGRVMQALLAMFRSGIEPQRRAVTLAQLLPMLSYNELDVRVERDAQFTADPDLLLAVLQNLFDNAQRHRARRLALGVAEEDGCIRLQLRDDGEGCPPARLDELRAALARQDYGPGSGLGGLGLILADLVVRAHGGKLLLSDVREGFAVALEWPAAPGDVPGATEPPRGNGPS